MGLVQTVSKARKKKVTPRPLLENDRNYSVAEAAAAAGCAEITAWRAIYSGRLQTYRIGRRRVVSGAQVRQWLEAGGQTA